MLIQKHCTLSHSDFEQLLCLAAGASALRAESLSVEMERARIAVGSATALDLVRLEA
ncbi:hypothetical protein [Devosia submarina]|uniref:hypothetical protein n=1 Tax=Devosia submarina TaxID=1173082 RepID=UPI00130048E3|nr:hypothetical protein [Devosia submarina]